MQYRKLGRTKLKVSVISFGGGPFRSENFSKEAVKELILFALDKGINFIETGEDYDESKIGFALEGKRGDVYLATKSTETDKERLDTSIKNSLKNLNTDYIDIYQLHSVNSENELNLKLKSGALLTLKKSKSEGLIHNVGITGHHIPTLIRAVKTNEFDTVQVPYNITHTLAEELFDICKDYGVGVMVMKPMGGGFLIDPKVYGEIPKKGAQNMTAENALRFVLSNEKIHTALVGMRDPKQIEENIKICNLNLNLPEKERLSITKRAKEFFGDDYCRTCKYCLPCEVYGWGFEIDTYLRFLGFYEKYGYKIFRKEYSNLPIKADACMQCGKCEPKCPYKIPIRRRLKEAHEKLIIKEQTDPEKEELFKINLLLNKPEVYKHDPIFSIIKKFWYRKFSQISHLDAGMVYKFSRFFKNNKDYNLSIFCLSELIKSDSVNDVYFRDLGECYMEKKEFEKAIEYLGRAAELNPGREWTWFSLGKCYVAVKQYDKAIYALQQSLRVKNQGSLAEFHTHYYLAICYVAMNQKDKALEHFGETTKFDQQIRDAEPTDFDEGVLFYQFLYDQGYREVAYKLGRAYKDEQQYDKAIKYLQEILKKDSANDIYQRDIGECYMEKKEYEKAINYLKKATEINPDREWTWFSLGKCYTATKQYDKAIQVLQQNLKIKNQNQLANYHTHYYLAICYTATNQKDKALKHYQETTKYDQQIKNTELPEEKQLKKILMEENGI